MLATLDVAGISIPKLGLGTFNLNDDHCRRVVAGGIKAGYRHVDTAEMYQNERAVGEGIRDSGVPREEVFVTSKVWRDHLHDGLLQAAAEASLQRLGFDQLDLYLIHWPNDEVPLAEAIKALCDVKQRGLARAIGVSNFPVKLLDEAVSLARYPLAINQVEYHPFLDQSKVLEALERHDMGLTAYCPLARGRTLTNPVIAEIADRHGVHASVIAIAWLIGQERVIAIPKSGSVERVAVNLQAQAVQLSPAERQAISALATPGGRVIDPAFAPQWDGHAS